MLTVLTSFVRHISFEQRKSIVDIDFLIRFEWSINRNSFESFTLHSHKDSISFSRSNQIKIASVRYLCRTLVFFVSNDSGKCLLQSSKYNRFITENHHAADFLQERDSMFRSNKQTDPIFIFFRKSSNKKIARGALPNKNVFLPGIQSSDWNAFIAITD